MKKRRQITMRLHEKFSLRNYLAGTMLFKVVLSVFFFFPPQLDTVDGKEVVRTTNEELLSCT